MICITARNEIAICSAFWLDVAISYWQLSCRLLFNVERAVTSLSSITSTSDGSVLGDSVTPGLCFGKKFLANSKYQNLETLSIGTEVAGRLTFICFSKVFQSYWEVGMVHVFVKTLCTKCCLDSDKRSSV